MRRFIAVIAVGNLAWECAQLPLYTLWRTGSVSQIAFAVFHCTGGDILIAAATLVGSLLLLGTAGWPSNRYLPVAGATLLSGILTTAYSEHVNIARGAWTYSELMPLLPGTDIGLAPLAQWIVIPLLAFVVVRPPHPLSGIDLPIMGVTTSATTPGHVARSHRSRS